MWRHPLLSAVLLILLLGSAGIPAHAASATTQSIIVEVEGNPAEHEAHFKKHYPYIEVIARYDILFNGLALKVPTLKIGELAPIDFIKAIHEVQMYETSVSRRFNVKSYPDATIPSDLNPTKFTGKGVKIGVIDTGIDYDHPDLAGNYQGGYDVVDLDDDPMETVAAEGEATLHGTHVAGIIAANGELKGVAPGSDLYAYRALGPGGRGTTVQIIAAMEQAIKDGVDIMNLSLGNTVNGPDYPTSIAVNKAIDLGVAVVIANGNSGPDNWTVGSPATASKALSVGASAKTQQVPFLYDAQAHKYISFALMRGSTPWKFKKDYQVVTNDAADVTGKIGLIERGKTPFHEMAHEAEQNGAVAVLIYNNEAGELAGSIENDEHPLTIPVAGISQEAGLFLKESQEAKSLYLNTVYHQIEKGVASFSSRGPVTLNWKIKPDILAPGTAVLSTVPGNGYLELQGTSMAAPHVAGAIAVVKEAKPNWTNEQIIGALKTTACQLKKTDGTLYEPIDQGAGEIRIEQALATKTIISDPLLTFAKIVDYNETKTVEITIENTTDERQAYYFSVPKQQRGLVWKLPHSFVLEKNQVKTIPIELNVTSQQLDEAIHQGWLTLHQANDAYHLPYVFINKTADFAKTSGFQFALKTFSDDLYSYRLHVADQVKRIDIHLYDRDTLIYQGKLLTLTDLDLGINEGEISKGKVNHRGAFKVLLSVELANGTYETHETDIYIE